MPGTAPSTESKAHLLCLHKSALLQPVGPYSCFALQFWVMSSVRVKRDGKAAAAQLLVWK